MAFTAINVISVPTVRLHGSIFATVCQQHHQYWLANFVLITAILPTLKYASQWDLWVFAAAQFHTAFINCDCLWKTPNYWIPAYHCIELMFMQTVEIRDLNDNHYLFIFYASDYTKKTLTEFDLDWQKVYFRYRSQKQESWINSKPELPITSNIQVWILYLLEKKKNNWSCQLYI